MSAPGPLLPPSRAAPKAVPRPDVPAGFPRVMVIGLDGATFDVFGPLAQRGVLPNIGRLMQESALANLDSTRPYITPVAWTTFQTGCQPADHGIFDYRFLDHERRALLMNRPGRISATTLFEAVSLAGGDTVSLSLPMTSSAGPRRVRGIVVGGLDCPSIDDELAEHPALARKLQARGVRLSLDPIWRERPTSLAQLRGLVARTQADFQARVVAARITDLDTSWRLMVVQFQALDALQHRAWHLLGLDPAAEGPQEWVREIHRALRTLDDCVGELVGLAERRGAALVVLSDHGFGPFQEQVNVPELLAGRGLLAWPRGAWGAVYHLRRGWWKLRKIARRGFLRGRSTATMCRPLGTLLPIDWRRSAAVTLHGSLGGLVYVNTRRRFGGPLRSSRQVEQALSDSAAAFAEALHPITGQRLFAEVFCTASHVGCDPIEKMAPDLVAIPAAGFHTRHKLDAAHRLLLSDRELTGTHRPEGVLMIRARGARQSAPGAELRDVAPTILRMLDIPIPETMTGRAMIGGEHPRATRTRVAPLSALAHSHLAESDQALVEARLRAMGYVE